MKYNRLFFLTSVLCSGVYATTNTNITIDSKTLQLNVAGSPYFIRGIGYSPEPRGFTNNSLSTQNATWHYGNPGFIFGGKVPSNNYTGAWICGPANEYSSSYANLNWQSACQDNDLTSQISFSSTDDNAYNSAIQQLWKRDLDDMQSLGINTIRLYDVQSGLSNNQVLFKTHSAFLSTAQTHNIKVVFPLLPVYNVTTYVDNNQISTAVQLATNLVNETCPNGVLNQAILAYNLGNEIITSDDSLGKNSVRYDAMKRIIEMVNNKCPGALKTYATIDEPDLWGYENNASSLLDSLGNLKARTTSATGTTSS